jgi:hypothetical protein
MNMNVDIGMPEHSPPIRCCRHSVELAMMPLKRKCILRQK